MSRFPTLVGPVASMAARPKKNAVLGAAHVATRARSPRKARAVRRSRRCLRDLLLQGLVPVLLVLLVLEHDVGEDLARPGPAVKQMP